MLDNIFLWIALLIVSLFVLVKAADYFNQATERIGRSFGLSPFLIGILIVSVGTSLPELVSSIIAVMQGASEIVAGNVLGSNITNIFLILGIATIVNNKPIHVQSKFINVDLQFLLGSALFVGIAIVDGSFNIYEGLLCIVGFIIYLLYLIRNDHHPGLAINEFYDDLKVVVSWKDYLVFVASAGLIYIGGEFTIISAIEISEYFGIGKDIIAASTIALGTSIPELIVSIDAIRKGKTDYAMGNILGSSIFNLFWVMGISSLFGKIMISESTQKVLLPFMLIATFIYFIVTRDKRITKWEGMLFLLFYVLFISKLFAIF